MQRSISYGDARIDFTIRLSPGRPNAGASSRVRISLLTDGRVEAHAPDGTDAEAVVRTVRRRARWIWQQLDAWRARRVHVLPRAYVSGESHFYLGRRHVLKVHVAADAVPGFKLLRGRLDVTARRRYSPDGSR